MELVASARLRRAQKRIEAMRPYADRMLELMAGTARASSSVRGLPLLQRRDASAVAIVPLTGDRGLAGAFNAQILRRATALSRELQRDGVDVRWLPVGRKGISTLNKTNRASRGKKKPYCYQVDHTIPSRSAAGGGRSSPSSSSRRIARCSDFISARISPTSSIHDRLRGEVEVDALEPSSRSRTRWSPRQPSTSCSARARRAEVRGSRR